MGRATRLEYDSSTLYKVFEVKSLTIISHTEHYLHADGSIVGLGSTVTEINHLLSVFDTITHVAMLYDEQAPQSALPYNSNQIKFMALPAVGGPSLKDKMTILFTAPKVIGTVRRALKEADYFQFRAPTGIGVFVIPYLIMCSKKGWFKYAGNWKQGQAPLAYKFQKWLLEHQSRPVTINGFWEEQPKQCVSFENPCLTDQEIQEGQQVIACKTLQFPLELCFVGRMEPAKGVDLIFEALEGLDAVSLEKIKAIHFVGKGTCIRDYRRRAEKNALPVVFHGYLNRHQVHQIYLRSHAILLPSLSEGFPKVIAEGMNYGCIPIVSDVSSISHYVKNMENGYVMEALTKVALQECLLRLLNLKPYDYQQLKQRPIKFMEKFSYAYYNKRLLNTVV